MKRKTGKIFAADFETTVYDGQDNTEVWAAACVELYTENVQIFHSIGDLFTYFVDCHTNITAYFHNLKFDGAFWISYLLTELKYEQAYLQYTPDIASGEFLTNKEMKNNTFKYSISSKGMWYTITIKTNNHIIELRDSLKLLPFSLDRIGKSFETKHKKLTMEYTGLRYAGCTITPEEQQYISNDVLVLKEALEIMYNEGHNKLTIGSCCLSEFKTLTGIKLYKNLFPDLTEISIPKEYTYNTADAYIRKSYRGGWCYYVHGKENQIKTKGLTADVNSLYPSMMSSESGNRYPYGTPTFWQGDYIPKIAQLPEYYFFVRIKTKFHIKDGYLPFVQIKDSLLYNGRESLTTSDYYDKKTGKYYSQYKENGVIKDTRVTLTLTQTDYQLLQEHYILSDFEILDGCYFKSSIGLFDIYIDKYKQIKQTSTGAKRELAKLYLNNLYGKTATSTDSSFKVAYLKDDGALGFYTVVESKKQAGYIAVGSAITSYARNFTIRAAQQNYYGVDKRGFIYADTDSIHCDLSPDELKGVPIHPTDFCCWKLESYWDTAIFARQKSYIEHVTHADGKPVEPYYNMKCAGMPEKCKNLFIESMTDNPNTTGKTEREKEFLKTKRTLTDFKVGLTIPGKLVPVQIRGGVLLCETDYTMNNLFMT